MQTGKSVTLRTCVPAYLRPHVCRIAVPRQRLRPSWTARLKHRGERIWCGGVRVSRADVARLRGGGSALASAFAVTARRLASGVVATCAVSGDQSATK